MTQSERIIRADLAVAPSSDIVLRELLRELADEMAPALAAVREPSPGDRHPMPMLDAQIGAVLHEGCVGVREWLSELEPGVLERSRTFFANIARDGLQQALKQARAIRTRSSLTEETNARTQEERS